MLVARLIVVAAFNCGFSLELLCLTFNLIDYGNSTAFVLFDFVYMFCTFDCLLFDLLFVGLFVVFICWVFDFNFVCVRCWFGFGVFLFMVV